MPKTLNPKPQTPNPSHYEKKANKGPGILEHRPRIAQSAAPESRQDLLPLEAAHHESLEDRAQGFWGFRV